MTDTVKKDFKVVENFKWFIILPLVLILAGVVCICVGRFNVGMDFSGGAKIEIELGDFAKDSEVRKDFESKYAQFLQEKGFEVVDNMQVSTPATGVIYEFRLSYSLNGKKLGSGAEEQAEFNKALGQDLDDDTGLRGQMQENILAEFITQNGANVEDYTEDFVRAYTVGATASSSLLRAAIWAIVAAIAIMLVYIMVRFTVSGAFAAITVLLHDVLIMVSLTAIFNIPVNSTFIAAIITIIGYSINATIVIFDKIRECRKSAAFNELSDTFVANYSVKQSLVKVLLSSLTTLIMVVALVIVSGSTIREFILPIIFGLFAGSYSATLLSSSFWVAYRKLGAKIKAASKAKKAKKA